MSLQYSIYIYAISHQETTILNSISTTASRFKMTFSARWLEIDSHLGWSVLLQSVLWPSWHNTHKSKWNNGGGSHFAGHVCCHLAHLSLNHIRDLMHPCDWSYQKSVPAFFFFFRLSPVISNVAPLQTTHPCAALSVSQMHRSAFDKTPAIPFKFLRNAWAARVSLRSHLLVQTWEEERIVSTVWATLPSHVQYSDLSTITMETL